MKRKHIIIVAGSLAGLGLIAFFAMRSRKKKEVADILDKIDKGVKETGTIKDLAGDIAFNENQPIPNGTSLLKVATAQAYAKKMYGLFDQYLGTYDDEEGAIALLSQIKTKVKLSQVAKEFRKIYGQHLGQFLTEKIDKSPNPQTLKMVINNMSKY